MIVGVNSTQGLLIQTLMHFTLMAHREMGKKYQEEVLSHGGGKPPRMLVEEFLERRVESVSTVKALMTDLDQKKGQVAAALT